MKKSEKMKTRQNKFRGTVCDFTYVSRYQHSVTPKFSRSIEARRFCGTTELSGKYFLMGKTLS